MNIVDRIVNLDLSMYKLKSLSSQQVYIGLQILNLSNNCFSNTFDCSKISIMAPLLKTLDLSSNKISKITNIPQTLQILRVNKNPIDLASIVSDNIRYLEVAQTCQNINIKQLTQQNRQLKSILVSDKEQYDKNDANKLNIKVTRVYEGAPFVGIPVKTRREIVFDYLDYQLDQILNTV